MSLKSPCETKHCTECTYPDCREYRIFIRLFWARCGRRRMEAPAARREDVFRYDAPYLVAQSLDKGPCEACSHHRSCGDREGCEAYEDWTRARLRRIRHRLGCSFVEN